MKSWKAAILRWRPVRSWYPEIGLTFTQRHIVGTVPRTWLLCVIFVRIARLCFDLTAYSLVYWKHHRIWKRATSTPWILLLHACLSVYPNKESKRLESWKTNAFVSEVRCCSKDVVQLPHDYNIYISDKLAELRKKLRFSQLEETQAFFPCPGATSQVCGRLNSTEKMITYPYMANVEGIGINFWFLLKRSKRFMQFSDIDQHLYSSCDQMRENGIFVNGKYRLKGSNDLVDCKLWGKGRVLDLLWLCYI